MKIIKVHITCPIQLINVNALLNKLYNDFILYIIKYIKNKMNENFFYVNKNII